jgi:carboxylesterase type B
MPTYGATHFSEVAYVFHNVINQGYGANGPFVDAPEEKLKLAKLMSNMWVSFIHDLDPNNHRSTLNPPSSIQGKFYLCDGS